MQGRWFALVGMTTLGATLFHHVGTRSGTRELRDGVLTWPPHSRQPGWQAPVPELAVERVRFGVGNVQPITLESAASGTVGVHVSLDAMPTAFTLNATKQRNLAYADDFVAALLAAGARPR